MNKNIELWCVTDEETLDDFYILIDKDNEETSVYTNKIYKRYVDTCVARYIGILDISNGDNIFEGSAKEFSGYARKMYGNDVNCLMEDIAKAEPCKTISVLPCAMELKLAVH